MRERPIMFSSPMAKALLEGRKIQTRRLVKPQPPATATNVHLAGDHVVYRDFGSRGPSFEGGAVCRYGEPGDRLWVREAFSAWFAGRHWYEREKGTRRKVDLTNLFYRATHPYPDDDQKWIPSIFMPRWASRLTLELTEIRVERLHDIPDEDLLAEGAQYPVNAEGNALIRLTGKYPPCDYHRKINIRAGESLTHEELLRAHFASLWDTLNGNWHANPWVWVVGFKVLPHE